MDKTYDIHVSGGILIRDRQVLAARSYGKEYFVSPGGKLEQNETASEALIRELKEELQLVVAVKDLEYFDTFYALAAGQSNKRLRMDLYFVTSWTGEPLADHEIEEIRWFNSKIPADCKIGSILEHEIMPRLKSAGMIS